MTTWWTRMRKRHPLFPLMAATAAAMILLPVLAHLLAAAVDCPSPPRACLIRG